MALTLPDHINPGDSGHIADMNLIIAALADLDSRGTSRVTHPNTTDVLVQAWDAANSRWQINYYDSGLRNITGLLINGWTADGVTLSRTAGIVQVKFAGLTGAAATADEVLQLPAGFRPLGSATVGTSLPMAYESSVKSAVDVVTVRAGNQATPYGIAIEPPITGAWLYGQLQCVCDATVPATLPGSTLSSGSA